MKVFLGIDIGSISINVVAIDAEGRTLMTHYARVDGKPVDALQAVLTWTASVLPDGAEVSGLGTTGSARYLAAAVTGADIVKNEITAHARASICLHPEVRTIFEIGGQDSKITIIRDGVVVDFAMNMVCAAGTGSFLDSQAKRLNMDVERLGKLAVLSDAPTPIAGRCTVFAESDMIHKQQIGYRQEDILMGLCHAMVRNYLGNVCKGKPITPPIVFQGGVSANPGIQRAFRDILHCDPIIPEHHMVMGAYGAALLARRTNQTRFRGFDVADHKIETRGSRCEDCANQCEIVEVQDEGAILRRSGGRCGKWETSHDPSPMPAIRPEGVQVATGQTPSDG
jgi:predicted CoA-substrate-specific enzyme activase